MNQPERQSEHASIEWAVKSIGTAVMTAPKV
jgi:hypothetical protein